ncbi:hypothetical protein [Microbispora sp. GKU 823]|uniref:hypothetical protein n=1 Tax=Microbispora sp. GKU 823 TaxID=1652100 RepID=UPI0021181085|nr:hypothetical protein [Microbispora sp. GKU 823]
MEPGPAVFGAAVSPPTAVISCSAAGSRSTAAARTALAAAGDRQDIRSAIASRSSSGTPARSTARSSASGSSAPGGEAGRDRTSSSTTNGMPAVRSCSRVTNPGDRSERSSSAPARLATPDASSGASRTTTLAVSGWCR